MRMPSGTTAPVSSPADEIHYFQKPMRRQFRFATERQSDSSRVLAEGSPVCKHERCRSGGNAVVVIPASGSDEARNCAAADVELVLPTGAE